MVLLEGKHGSQANRAGTASTNVDTKGLGLGEELVSLGAVKGNEGALALTTEVLEVFGVLGGEALDLAVEVVTDAGGVVDEVVALNLLDNGAEDEGASRVAHPGVELAVRLVGTEILGGVVVAGGLGLLGEGDDVRGVLEVPVLVGPEFASSTDTGLDLVGDEEDIVLAGQGAELLEEFGGGVVVTALGLDGLDHDGAGWEVPRLDEVLDFVERRLLGGGVLGGVLVKRVLELGEGGLGPVEGGDVELVDGLGAGGGQRAEETAVESGLEREDGELGRTRRLVVHGGLHLSLGEVDLGATTLELATVHESRLVGNLVGVRTSESSVDIVEALGGDLENTGLEDLSPVVGGEVSEGRTVDEGVDHLGSRSSLGQVGVVVANGDGSNLSIAAWLY